MKKFVLLIFIMLSMLTYTACHNTSKSPGGVDDYKEKMKAVTNEIKQNKHHDKALLLVSFGSTHEEPQSTFKSLKKAFADKFADFDVYFSFTSEICIARCAAKGLKFYSPSFYLNALGHAGYNDIAVQSLHVIPGEEYLRVKNMIKDFHNNGDYPEFAKIAVYLGGPLLDDENDVEQLALILNNIYEEDVNKGKAVVFMGHGNTDTENYTNGNSRYTMLEKALQKLSARYFVATVDMKDNLVDDMIKRMKESGIEAGTDVLCQPLMSTAGDHARNDMLGGSAASAEEGSWRYELTKAGYNCPLENCHIKGLGDYPVIINIWMSHLDKALKGISFFSAD